MFNINNKTLFILIAVIVGVNLVVLGYFVLARNNFGTPCEGEGGIITPQNSESETNGKNIYIAGSEERARLRNAEAIGQCVNN